MKISAYSHKDHEAVMAFLLKYERYAVNLLQEFLKGSIPFYLLKNNDELEGVFCFPVSGQIKHCLPFNSREKIKDAGTALIEFFKKNTSHKFFSLVGEKTGTEIFRKVIEVTVHKEEHHSQQYILMEDKNLEQSYYELRDGCEIEKCSVEDAKELLPIQKAYELEEVYYDKKDFKTSVCLFNLEKSLKENYVAGLKFDGRFAAKGGSNAMGENFVQLGGIFTSKEFRGQGFASAIVQHLTGTFAGQNKKCVLFVKIQNEKAINLYKKCGFEEIAKFEIVYY